MSKALFELQNNIKNLRQQLSDRIHLAFLNHQSYLCVKSSTNQPFQQISCNLQSEHQSTGQTDLKTNNQKEKSKQNHQLSDTHQLNSVIQTKLKNLSQIFQKRSENHLNYLIIKQIQSEQECVRRDRLTEYEQKIYDQRRLISDKEVFTQSLLRPKKQRPENMSSEQFQQVRAVEKVEEQKAKVVALEEEVKNLQLFKKKLSECHMKNMRGNPNEVLLKKKMETYGKIKSEDLQKTKANSLDTVNTSNMNNICEKQQKPFEEQEFNSQIPTINEDQVKNVEPEKTKTQGDCSVEQVTKQRQLNQGCYSVSIQKLIEGYEKRANQQEIKQKYKKINELLMRIREKKQENLGKSKQWKQLEIENAHMKAHLKRTREMYVQTRNAHYTIVTTPK